MKTFRPDWVPKRVHEEWEKMRLDSEVERAYGGPDDAPLQLRIPAWIIGEGNTRVNTQENYQDRSVESGARKAEWDTSKIDLVVKDCERGFDSLSTAILAIARIGVNEDSVALIRDEIGPTNMPVWRYFQNGN